MSAAPLCSVVVPLFRHEAFVADALESVAAQTHLPLELIVIDDCSPDRSFQVAQRCLEQPQLRGRFTRVVCERNETNRGAPATLNRGLAQARGDYVFLLNSDDRFAPRRVQRLLELMQASRRGFAFSAVRLRSEPGQSIPASLIALLGYLQQKTASLPALSFGFLRYQLAVTTGNFALSRRLIDEVGPFADLTLVHDREFILRVTALEEPLFVDEPLYEYRLHGDNSFLDLAAQSQAQTRVALTHYFERVAAGAVRNPLAPTPANWPGVFEYYLKIWDWQLLWQQVSQRTRAAVRSEGAA
jgi:glycosyltransferase involved in cell wall biosynthesis